MASERTQKMVILKWLFGMLSFISVVLPLLIPILNAWFNNEIVMT